MRAFQAAVDLGYRYIETDVRATRDGIAVVFHDALLERVSNGRGPLVALDWADLSHVRVAGTEPIPRLDELLSSWPELKLNIEPKSNDVLVPLAEAIRRADAVDRVCIGCFDTRRTAAMRELLGPKLCTAVGPFDALRLKLAAFGIPLGSPDAGCAQVPVEHRGLIVVDRRFLAAAHARGVQVHVWTIDDEAQMEQLVDLGVDGIMSDRPAVLRGVLQRRGLWG